MGALKGSLTFKNFYVDGEPPNDFQDDYIQKLKNKAFQSLSPIGDDERTIGWVTVQKPLEADFQRANIFFNQYILFALRIDKWSIPSNILNARLEQITEQRYPSQNEDSPKLSKRIKQELKEEVLRELKLKSLPTMKIVDVMWNFTERKLQFYATNQALCEEFMEFFEETFNINLIPDSPYTLAKSLNLEEQKMQQLILAKPWAYNLDE